MGLGFLPWELLPAYVFGPLIGGLNLWSLIISDNQSLIDWILQVFGVAFGIWVVWTRYKTGIEPLWNEERRNKARKLKEATK